MSQTRITATVRKKAMHCRECGGLIEVGSNTRNQPRHFECGIQVAIEAGRQMKAKRGPYYERWRMGMILAAERLRRTTPPL
jgi:hypothetical protein